MTRQEKIVVLGLLSALLLGVAVRSCRRGGGVDLPHPSLKTGPLSP